MHWTFYETRVIKTVNLFKFTSPTKGKRMCGTKYGKSSHTHTHVRPVMFHIQTIQICEVEYRLKHIHIYGGG